MTSQAQATAGIRTNGRVSGSLAWMLGGAVLIALVFVGLDLLAIEYVYLAAYSVLQYVVIATAWNVLGGYAGYINFGAAAFFALGTYTTVFIHQAFELDLLASIPASAVIAGLVGLATGYLTLRLRGVFWPESVPFFSSYAQFLFAVMLALAIGSVLIARAIERSWLGQGFGAIREDETAAECCGVPTLRLKLIATMISGALMGVAGAPFPYFVTYVDPNSAFNLSISVNSVAMPLIGGTVSWVGPVIGAILLGSVQQIITVTISSQLNLMIVGVLLVVFVAAAPNGIIGVFSALKNRNST